MEKARALENAASKASNKASLGISSGSKRKPEIEPEGQLEVFDELSKSDPEWTRLGPTCPLLSLPGLRSWLG